MLVLTRYRWYSVIVQILSIHSLKALMGGRSGDLGASLQHPWEISDLSMRIKALKDNSLHAASGRKPFKGWRYPNDMRLDSQSGY